MPKLSTFHAILKVKGFKVTTARVAALEILAATSNPLDAARLQENLEKHKIKCDTVTVYRILEAFMKVGLVTRVELGEGKFRYELASRNHHHHLICEDCGKVEDVDACVKDSLVKMIDEQKQFQVHRHSLEFFGRCSECR